MNALDRIRRFSLVTWALGTIVIAVIAFLVFPLVGINPNTGAVYVGGADDGEFDYPWLTDDAQELPIVDGVIHGAPEGGYVRFDGGSDLLLITPAADLDDDTWVPVYQQQGTERDPESDAWERPGFIGSMYPRTEVAVLPGEQDGLIWFSASDRDWTATLSRPEVTPMDGTASGTGNALLMYEGAALSGRFQHTGTGIFLVAAVTAGDWDSLVNEVDEVDQRVSWKPTDRVVFQVQADTGDGSWTITLDTPAGTTADPDPSPTP